MIYEKSEKVFKLAKFCAAYKSEKILSFSFVDKTVKLKI